jgi:hypothetical protein
MIILGYKLSSEEHSPLDLVRYAQMAQDSGYDHICVHQVGKEQKGFFELYADAILPQLRTLRAPRGKRRGEARRRRKS